MAKERVLSCVSCQTRKKKCNRKSPCSNCIKLQIQCIPSTPAPPRKRRKPTEELLERLMRCEELLKQCTCINRDVASPKPSIEQPTTPPDSPTGEPISKLPGRESWIRTVAIDTTNQQSPP